MSEQQARTLLGGFQFSGDEVFRPVSVLSGGEQSRIRLIKLLLTAPNVLVLDEPTNHLDIPSREALEDALAEYPGTIIAVSHDRYFLDRIATRMLVMRPEGYRLIHGNYTEYVQRVSRPGRIRRSGGQDRPSPRQPIGANAQGDPALGDGEVRRAVHRAA